MFHKGKHDREKQLRFSIRKVSFGAASIAVAALFIFLGNGAVSAAEQGVPSTNGETQAPQPKNQNAQNGTYEGNTVATSSAATVETNTQPSTVENSPSPESAPQKVETLYKKELTDLIKEIDGKFAKGTYATKTEESVNNLRSVLEEARTVLSNAKTQAELSQAHAKLVTATTQLKTKPKEKKQAPAVDTTNGKATVGIKATNTEKSSDSNSIANSGSRDERNGKALDKSNPFRTDATTTDTHANNEAGVSIINGNFEEGTVKPTGNEKIVTNDASNVVGWKVVDSKQTEIPIANSSKRLAWVTAGSIDWNHPYGVVMAGYRSLKTQYNPGTDKVDTIGKIYQDIKVTPGSEVLVKYRTTSFGNGYGFSTVKMTVKNPDTGEVYYTGRPNELSGFSDGLAFINVPKDVTKIRLEFEDADNFTHSSQSYDDSFISKNGTKLYPGGILSNVRVNTGAYVVAKDNQTKYEVTSSSRDVTTTSKEITVKVENKGWESTDSGVKYKVDLPQGVTVTYNGKTYSEKMELDLGSIGDKKEKTFKYTVNIPAGTPSITNLVGKVEYKTWQNSQAVPYGETKTGVVPIPDQNVELKMFKTELETAVAGAASLNQNEYTPDSWKKFQDEITKAREILNEEQNNVPVNQRKSQSEINNQVDLLRAKQNSLTIAATTTEKNNLSAKVAELTKASTENKTPKSIDKYNEEFKKFEQDYNSIKTEVSNIIAKGNNATKAEVDTALSKVAEIKRKLDTAAGLLVDKGNKTELEKAVREESTVKGNFKYYNADKTKRDAYDSAITKGNTVINDNNATQDQVDAALRAITEAKAALTGAATNKEALREASTTDAERTKTTDAKYYNEKDPAKKQAYDNAVSAAAGVLSNNNATQDQVDAALRAITEAKAALTGAATNKEALREASTTDAERTKTTDAKYYNEKDPAKKQAYDNAVSAAAGVLSNNNATQDQVDAALRAITEAKAALTGAATNKEALREASTTDAERTKTTDAKYYNEKDPAKKQAYDNAVSAAAGVLSNNNATQDQVDAALRAITEAKAALTGAATNKEALREASTTDAERTKTTDAKYYNEKDPAKKQAYDNAVSAAAGVLSNNNATQDQVDAALRAITEAKAALTGAATNKEALREASTTDAERTKTTDAKYYNEKDPAKKQAYDNAVSAAAGVLSNNNATQDQVDAALRAITEAKAALTGAATNKEALREASTTDAERTKTTDAKYYNEKDPAKKQAYDNAVSAAAGVLSNNNATQDQVDAALRAITEAKAALTGAATNKEALREASTTDAERTKTTDAKYYNEKDPAKKQAYDNAVSAAAGVLSNNNATQDQVDAALRAITEAKAALTGAATNKEALREASTTDAERTKTTDAKYYNEKDPAKKQAYDNAVSAAAGVLSNNNATQDQVDAALRAITEAKAALTGAATNKEALREASTTDAERTKTTDAKYYNEKDPAKKQAYDNAVSAAAGVLSNNNATQDQVDAALRAITEAKAALTGAATNKEALREASTTDAERTKTTDAKYYNEKDPAKKQAYDNAVSAAAGVLSNNNATQDQVDAALRAITEAKAALTGAATNKEALREASTTDAERTKTTDAKYYNEKDPAKKQAYDNAVSAAAGVLSNNNATQDQVDAALRAITEAKAALTGAATNKEALREASTTDAERTKTTDAKYYNEKDPAKKQAYDNAVSAAAGVLSNNNATQDQVDAALRAITEAKAALTGAATNKEALREASTTDAERTKTTDAKYYNEKDPAKKQAYDNAVSAAAGVLSNNNATQDQVDAALRAITEAKAALTGAATNKEALREASTTDAERTKTTDAKYYNEKDPAKKQAYDNAVSAAAGVLSNNNATQDQVDAALRAITEAKAALTGAATNKEALREASTTDAERTKTTDAKYYNEKDPAKKQAYDNAVSAAAGVLSNNNATQDQVDAALRAITEAKAALTGAATNKEALREASTTDAERTKTTDAKYYNEKDPAKKQAYDNAVSAAAGVLSNNNATQDQVDAALRAITEAKAALTGAATNKEALREASTTDAERTKTTDAKYYNEKDPAKKQAYDNAVSAAAGVLSNNNATQDQVDAALRAITEAKAALTGAATNKEALREASTTDAERTKTTDAKYYNEKDPAKKQAYDNAVSAAAGVLSNNNATQDQVDAALRAITEAKAALTGAATNKEALREASTTDAERTKTTDAKYYNEKDPAKKQAYDNAVSAAAGVLSNNNATQDQVDAALRAITEAKAALTGAATNKEALREASTTDAERTKTTDAKYYNEKDPAKKQAYDNAVSAAAGVLSNNNATQDQVDAALRAITEAKAALTGAATNKEALREASTTDAERTKTTDAKYYNEKDPAKKQAYDNAVSAAAGVLSNNNATQDQVDAALRAITEAKAALTGAATNKEALREASTTDAERTKTTDAKYYNEKDPAKKQAYDNAVSAAAGVLSNNNATQDQVDAALRAITEAKAALTGAATNKEALREASTTDAERTKTTDAKYYNEKDPAKKQAYDNAVSAAAGVLSNNNATQDQVDAALRAITEAKAALTGAATNKEALREASTTDAERTKTTDAKYYNEKDPAKKQAYDNAVSAAAGVLSNNNATQDQVDAALRAITEAKAALTGAATNKEALREASTTDAERTKTTDAKYYNEKDPAKKQAYDNAVSAAAGVLSNNNATQDQVDAALRAITEAKAALTGAATNKEALREASTTDAERTKTTDAKYYNEKDPAKKQAYDNAVSAAAGVLSNNNATQDQVDAALRAITEAKAALTGAATNKEALREASTTDAERTKTTDAKYYNEKDPAKKQAYDNAVSAAAGVLSNNNATQDQVDAALRAITEAKAALTGAATNKEALREASTTDAERTKTTDAKYYNEKDPAKKQAYDNAVSAAAGVLSNNNATQDQVDAALRAITEAKAALTGAATNKEALREASTTDAERTKTTDAKYYNEKDPAKKQAYDNAVSAAAGVLSNNNATQDQVDAALRAITEAKAALTGAATNKEALREASTTDAERTKTTDAKYYNEKDPAKKQAYDNAVSAAAGVLSNNNATQDQVDAALRAITEAKAALTGAATNKEALREASTTDAERTKTTDAKYYNEKDPAKKQAYDNAVSAAAGVLSNNNATQDQVDAALRAITEAKAALTGAATNKEALREASTTDAERTKTTDAKYYNEKDPAKKQAYDNAVSAAAGVLSNNNATQDQVDAALRAITEAKAALTGAATNKEALREASTTDAERTKTTDAKYYNEKDPAKKQAYDNAVSAAAGVLSNNNATQDQVDAALRAITEAKAALTGAATNKEALREASTTDAERTKTTDAKYYNEKDPAKKQAYDNAVSAAAGVLSNNNATQDQVDAALRAITEAKAALTGAATNKEALREASTTDAERTKTTDAKYYNEKDPAKKQAYDNAVSAAAGVLSNNNATQDQVDAALRAITEAKAALTGAATNKEALREASTTDAERTKTTDAKYYNEKDPAKKQAYDNAVSAAAGVLSNNNATQDQVDAALRAITEAKAALTGAATNKEALREASTTDAERTKTTDAKYYNEKDPAKKQAYDNAVSAAAGVLSNNNATQDQVDAALRAITEAKAALTGAATNKEALREASTTDAERTKTTDAKYYNEKDPAKKQAYDNAVSAAAGVLSNNNATQDQVDAALRAITEAKAALTGAATNKEALREASTTDAERTKTTDAKYYNEKDPAKKQAYDNAVSAAAGVLSNNNATQDQVDAALRAITEAKAALTGAATNKEALREASTTDAERTKTTDAKYYNEKDPAKKQAYDNAVSAAAGVLSNNNATQDQVDAALRAITEAKAVLTGAATNKEALREASTTDAERTKTTDAKYYNEKDPAKKQAYDNAVSAAAGVLSNNNATQDQVDAALRAITEAKAALTGAATNKEALREASTTDAERTKTTDAKYYNEKDPAKKQAYDNAVSAAAGVLSNNNATQDQVDAALRAITEAKAALTGAATNKEALREASTTDAERTKTTDAKYYNEKDPAKKQAYDNAVSAAAGVLSNNNATQDQVDAALRAITEAKAALTGAATNKEALREASTTDAERTKTTDAKYYNEKDPAKKQAYDNAVSAAAGVLSNNNATQDQVDAALRAITEAKAVLTGAATNKEALREASTTDAERTKTTDAKYYNEKDPAKKQAYDNAVSAAAGVLSNNNATQDQVDAALRAITEAKAALTGAATNKEALREASTTDAERTKTTDAKYYNEKDPAKKQAYDNAVSAAAGVLSNNNATQDQVDAALRAITEAKAALTGAATNKEALREASTTDAERTKTTDAKYYNEKDPAKKQAYDNAVSAAAGVLSNNNATQDQVDAALRAITEAKAALTGAATNKEALREASTTDAERTKTTDAKYYNEKDPAKKQAYDNAVSAAAGVLSNNNATQDQVDAALRAITEAKAALTGAATDKTQLTNTNDVLNDLIQEDPTKGKTKATIDEYKKVKEESEKLLKEVKKVIDNKNASQIEVNKALEMAIKAKDSLENAKKSLLDAVEAREVVETLANEKIASIKADKKLSAQEKEKAIDRVERLKKKALEEIDKSKKQIEIDKALRIFLYQMDQELLVFDRPELKVESALQASIIGTVIAERGKAIAQAEIIAKLNLPESITVISIDLPDTNILGDKFAKVMLRLPDGTEVTVKVPVRVVASQNGDSKPETALPDYGRNNGSTNTEATVDKAKLEGAIRQLDELIIQESAKFDAETAQEATALLAEAKAVFANAKASQAEVDAMVKRIEDFMGKVASSTNHATPANDQADQTPAVAPATTQAANASQTASEQTNTRTVAKELPNTGTADSTVAMVAAAASALLGLGLAGRRKEDEEA